MTTTLETSQSRNTNVTKVQHDTSNKLNIVNQSEVPKTQYISVSCLSSIELEPRYFMILSVVTDFKYNPLGMPFFEKYEQNNNI